MVCQEQGKSTYPSKVRAEEVARKRMRDNRTLILRPYLCRECGLWHLTSRADRYKPEPLED